MLIDQLEAGGEALARLVPAGGQLRAGGGEDDLVDVLRQLAAEDGGPATGEPLHQLAAEVLVPAHWRRTHRALSIPVDKERIRNGSGTVEIRTFKAFKAH
jgi:hypothetical protein